jgi:hypothetical protein
MSAVIPLGTFRRALITEAWPAEDTNFTRWLADSISLLGDTLNMNLEVVAVEERVGDFRADILARLTDEPEEHVVVIENQFGRTDHGHLGQILTYLAGVESAKTVVWIAETIRPDHRAAIDWLNTNTADHFSFFAIEIELWRIGDSTPAPRFNVVASPNDWTRELRSAVRQASEKVLAERHHIRLAYWASFAEYLKKSNSSFQINRPNKDMWKWFSIGRAGFGISATISTQKKRIGVEIYIHHDAEKVAFRALLAQKNSIENEIGEPLDWQELPSKEACRIALYKYGVDPSDEKQFPALHSWMLSRMDKFRSAFMPRVKSLVSESADADEVEEPLEE